MKDFTIEFLVTVLAIIFGLIIAKQAAKGLASLGVSISSNDPIIVATPASLKADAMQVTSPLVAANNTPAAMASAGAN